MRSLGSFGGHIWEVCLRDVERLLESGVPITKNNIDSYAPDDNISKERQQWQASYISRILRIFQQDQEGSDGQPEKSSEAS